MLNDNGFTRPQYDEIVSDLTVQWLQYFGADSNTTTHSVAGVLIRILAFFFDTIYQLIEVVYRAGFVDTATGVSLDRIGSTFGVTRNALSQAMVILHFTGKQGYVVPVGTLFKTVNELSYQLSENVVLDNNGNGQALAYATTFGAISNVSPNTITVQAEPVEDIITVTNPLAATGGADLESDVALQKRIKENNNTKPSSPINGLISSIKAVTSVKEVKVITNNEMDKDTYGNPPKSIHIYVDGGDTALVSEAIFNSVAAGVQTYGTITQKVTDIAGLSHTVSFDRATTKNIFVTVNLVTNSAFELYGVTQVKQVIADYLKTIPMGGIVRYSYLYKYIYDSISGIEVADVKIGVTESNMAMADITLGVFETASTSDDLMVINS